MVQDHQGKMVFTFGELINNEAKLRALLSSWDLNIFLR